MWNTDKDKVRQILQRHMDADGVDLSMRYFEGIKSFDAVAQGCYKLPDIAFAFRDYLTGFNGNKVFQQNASQLLPLMVHGFDAWCDALKEFESSGAKESTSAHVGRRNFHEVACMISRIQGRVDYANLRKQLLECEVL
jgi:hypothetical protein